VKTTLTYDALGVPYYAYTVAGKIVKDVVAKEVAEYTVGNDRRSLEWNLKNDKITTPKGGFPVYINGELEQRKTSLSSFLASVTDFSDKAEATNTDIVSSEYKVFVEDGAIVSAAITYKELVQVYSLNKKTDVVSYGNKSGHYTTPAAAFPDYENKGTEYYIVEKNLISFYDKELRYGYNSTILSAEKAAYYIGAFDYSSYDLRYDIITIDLGRRQGIVFFSLTKEQAAEVKTYTNKDKVEVIVYNDEVIYLKNLSK
jgi:hypothetical protein